MTATRTPDGEPARSKETLMRRMASAKTSGASAPRFEELESRLVLTIQAMSADELQSLLSFKQGKWQNIDPSLEIGRAHV